MVRLIGDIHGHISDESSTRPPAKPANAGRTYLRLLEGVEYSIQVGDLGFNYSDLLYVSPLRHRMIGGNHDNYPELPPHSLGNFGKASLGGLDFFFTRGAYSIDKAWRVPGIDWWPNEELNMEQAKDALAAYEEAKPSVMISHDCPTEVKEAFLPPKRVGRRDWPLISTNTDMLLQAMLAYHRPKFWYFGHYHNDKVVDQGGTRFQCLDELSYVDVNENGEPI